MISFVLAWVARVISGAAVTFTAPLDLYRQRVYFANHASHLDFVLVWAALPPKLRAMTRPVAARDYWDRPGFRRYLGVKVFNAVLVDRQPAQSSPQTAMDILLEGLGERHSLIIFPEGTRGDGSTIAPFKSGLYRLGKARPDVELIPAYINNLNRVLPKGEFVPVPMLASVSFGEPMHVGEDEEKNAFLDRARNAILELRQW